jgi:hypothetical protein
MQGEVTQLAGLREHQNRDAAVPGRLRVSLRQLDFNGSGAVIEVVLRMMLTMRLILSCTFRESGQLLIPFFACIAHTFDEALAKLALDYCSREHSPPAPQVAEEANRRISDPRRY